MILPPYITAILWAVLATTPRSWVMRITDMPNLSWSSRKSSRIWAWIVTSRAVVGSSAIRTCGSHARAMAMTTLWRMPPENWCGYCLRRSSAFGMPTSSSSSTARSAAFPPDMPRCRFRLSMIWRPTRIVGSSEVIGSWKTIAIFGPLISSMRFSESLRRSSPSKMISPPLTMVFDSGFRRIMLLAATDFPDPDSPTMASVSPRLRSKVAPRTACTSPAYVLKEMRRSSTLRTASPFTVATLLPHPRVEGVAQAVAEEPEANGDRDQHRGREYEQVRIEPHLVGPVVDQSPEGGGGRLDAEPDKAQERLEEDRRGHRVHQRDDDDVEDVGDEVLGYQAEGACPEGTRGEEELLLLEPEHLAPDQARRTSPAGKPYGDGQREDAGPEDQQGKDGDYEDGDAVQDLDDTLHNVVDLAAVVPRAGTVGHADAQVHCGNQGGDVQRDPGAHPDPVEHASPELVCTEPEPGERGRLVLPFEDLLDRSVGREPGTGDGQGEDEDDDAAGGDRDTVALQSSPGVAPETNRGARDLLHIFGALLYGLEEVGRERDLPIARLHLCSTPYA